MNFITLTDKIPINFQTEEYNISLDVKFGKGIDADFYIADNIRTKIQKKYNFEIFENDGKQMYRLLCEEGVFILNIDNVSVVPKNNLYKKYTDDGYILYEYGVSIALDMNIEPKYDSSTSFKSNNTERDGKPWIVKHGGSLKVDQNGEALFQWSTAKALDKGQKPTPEQELMGVEERHENSGMIYITIQPIYTEKYEEKELTRSFNISSANQSRGLTRGLTRGIGNQPESKAARVGYGNRASTKSISSSAIAIPNSRYILPIRLRIVGDANENVKCAKDIKSAMYVAELQDKTSVIPDFD